MILEPIPYALTAVIPYFIAGYKNRLVISKFYMITGLFHFTIDCNES